MHSVTQCRMLHVAHFPLQIHPRHCLWPVHLVIISLEVVSHLDKKTNKQKSFTAVFLILSYTRGCNKLICARICLGTSWRRVPVQKRWPGVLAALNPRLLSTYDENQRCVYEKISTHQRQYISKAKRKYEIKPKNTNGINLWGRSVFPEHALGYENPGLPTEPKPKTWSAALAWSPPIDPVFLSPSVLYNLPNCLFLPSRVGWGFLVHFF